MIPSDSEISASTDKASVVLVANDCWVILYPPTTLLSFLRSCGSKIFAIVDTVCVVTPHRPLTVSDAAWSGPTDCTAIAKLESDKRTVVGGAVARPELEREQRPVAVDDDLRRCLRDAAVDLRAGAPVGRELIAQRVGAARDPVDRNKLVATVEHPDGRRTLLDRGDLLRSADDFAMGEEQDPHDPERDRQVDRRPGQDHEDPLPHRLVVVGAVVDVVHLTLEVTNLCPELSFLTRQILRAPRVVGIGGLEVDQPPLQLVPCLVETNGLSRLFVRIHPGDLHVAAERDRTYPVHGLAPAHTPEHRPKEQRELLDTHADGLRRREVAGLVQDDERRDTEECQQVRHLVDLVWQGPAGA